MGHAHVRTVSYKHIELNLHIHIKSRALSNNLGIIHRMLLNAYIAHIQLNKIAFDGTEFNQRVLYKMKDAQLSRYFQKSTRWRIRMTYYDTQNLQQVQCRGQLTCLST